MTKFRTYKIVLHPKQNLGGEGASDRYTPAANLPVLYWSIFKKSRHLGFGVFVDIWSMTFGKQTQKVIKKIKEAKSHEKDSLNGDLIDLLREILEVVGSLEVAGNPVLVIRPEAMVPA